MDTIKNIMDEMLDDLEREQRAKAMAAHPAGRGLVAGKIGPR